MSARRDYAKKGKTTKSRKKGAKAANGQLWKIVLLSLTCVAIVLVYYARNDFQRLQLQHSAVAVVETPQTEKPQFEFYSKLPEAPRSTQEAKPPHQALYQIQLASFKQPQDADRLKAELLLDGYSVNVKPIRTSDQQIFLRVNVGPYQNLADAKAALQNLRAENYRGVINRIS